MTKYRNLIMGLGVLNASVIAVPSFANAQTAQPLPSSSDKATDASTTMPEQTDQEDIIVTAQKREQRLQDVALSITALSGENLVSQGITNSQDLSGRVVGISLHSIGAGVNILIRGIGSTSVSAQNETTSSFQVDGVYRAKPTNTNGTLYDVERLEVLKGPQGTLYGRNATVGAINVISRLPQFTDSAEVTAEAGNYGLVRGSGFVNAALSNTLAVRVAGQIVRRDGYTSNGTNDADDMAGRIRLRWEPDSKLSVLTTADYYHRGGAGPGATPINTIAGDTLFIASGNPYYSPFQNASVAVTDWGITSEINYDLGWSNLTFQPAYRFSDSEGRGQASSGVRFGADQEISADQGSAELRLSSPASSSIRWLLGGFFFLENTKQLANSISGRTPTTANPDDRSIQTTDATFETRSYAAFGQITVPLTDWFRVTGGLRYTHERKSLAGLGYTYTTLSSGGKLTDAQIVARRTALFPLNNAGSFNRLNWKAGIELDVSPDSMFYLNASTGFKAGGSNALDSALAPATSPRTFKPETLREIAGGWKNTFFDGMLTLNVEGYHWDYRNRQQLIRSPISIDAAGAQVIRFINYNLARQIIWGGALDATARITANDRLSFTVSYDNGRFTNDPANNLGGTNNFAGTRVPFQAPWQATFGYGHVFNLANGASLTADYYGQYKDGRFTETRSTPITFQPSYTKHDVALTYQSASDKFVVRGWVRNITNKAILSSTIASTSLATAYIAYYEPPRTYGASVTLRF